MEIRTRSWKEEWRLVVTYLGMDRLNILHVFLQVSQDVKICMQVSFNFILEDTKVVLNAKRKGVLHHVVHYTNGNHRPEWS